MKLHFLGTGAGSFRGTRRFPSSAFLGGLLLDCGAGTTGRLHDAHLFEQVDAVLLSHLHTDHMAGLPDFLLHTLITGRKRPLTILSPPGLSPILRAIFDARGTVVDPSELYEFRLIEGSGLEATVGPWAIRTVDLDHIVPNLGYLVSDGRVRLLASGDTREPSSAGSLRADYLVHEATFADRHADLARDYGHSTATQAAETAREVGARRLFINHIGDRPGSDEEIPREARRTFPDSTVVEDGQVYEL